MTYNELATKKTESMEVNCIIDDVVNNARWGFTKKAFKTATVSSYDLNKINETCSRYNVKTPNAVMDAITFGFTAINL